MKQLDSIATFDLGWLFHVQLDIFLNVVDLDAVIGDATDNQEVLAIRTQGQFADLQSC